MLCAGSGAEYETAVQVPRGVGLVHRAHVLEGAAAAARRRRGATGAPVLPGRRGPRLPQTSSAAGSLPRRLALLC